MIARSVRWTVGARAILGDATTQIGMGLFAFTMVLFWAFAARSELVPGRWSGSSAATALATMIVPVGAVVANVWWALR